MRERDDEVLHAGVARAQKTREFVQHAPQREQQRFRALDLELEIEARGVTVRQAENRPRVGSCADQAIEEVAQLQLRNV